jgi:hypothetical protein
LLRSAARKRIAACSQHRSLRIASFNADEEISEAYVALGRLNHVSKKHLQEVAKLQATLQAATGSAVAEAQDRIEKEVRNEGCFYTA